MVGWIMYYLGEILTEGWICERRMAQFQLYISPILASLVATIPATSIREGMLMVWDTRQASPSRTVLKNNTRSPSCRRLMVVGWSRSKVGVPVSMMLGGIMEGDDGWS